MSALLALFAAAVLAAAAPEVQVPQNDGWVTDLAGMLTSAQEQELELLMESYKQGAGHEIALLTVPTLEGETIEGLALAVARGWGLGEEDIHNGALLVVAQAERRLRIEVGRGLEGALPDAICGRIIANVITPAFKRGEFAGGIKAGILATHSAIGGDYGPLERTARARRSSGGLGGLGLFLFTFVLLTIFSRRGRGGGGGRGGGRSDSVWPWLLLGSSLSRGHHSSWSGGGGFGGSGGGGFGGFGGGGGFSGGGSSGGW